MTDTVRRLFVTAAEIFCIVGTLFGVGVLGTRVEESSGGALAADATLLAPLGPAFSIWSVIYAGLFAYTIAQWLPSRAADPRYRATGVLAGLSMILNAAWLLVTQQSWLWASVVVIVALAITLGLLLTSLATLPTSARGLDRLLLDGTFGLYTGWVAVATCANITATLVVSGVDPGIGIAAPIAVAVLIVATAVVGLILARTGRRLGVALAAAWGLAWIAVGRLTDEPASSLTGIAAAIAAVVVLALWWRQQEVRP